MGFLGGNVHIFLLVVCWIKDVFPPFGSCSSPSKCSLISLLLPVNSQAVSISSLRFSLLTKRNVEELLLPNTCKDGIFRSLFFSPWIKILRLSVQFRLLYHFFFSGCWLFCLIYIISGILMKLSIHYFCPISWDLISFLSWQI